MSEQTSGPAVPPRVDGAARRGLWRGGIDSVVGRVVPAVVRTVDVDEVLDRVAVDDLLDRVDVNRILDRVDPDRLLDRVDPDRLLDRVDVDRLLGRVDVKALAARADVGELVAQSTGRMAESTLDLVRRQLVALDLVLHAAVDRTFRRRPDERALGPTTLLELDGEGGTEPTGARARVTGRYAGAVTRLAGAAVDGALLTVAFSLVVAVAVFLLGLVTGGEVGTVDVGPWLGPVAYAVGWFLYHWIGLAAAGRTPGKAVVGTRVVRRDGSPVTPGTAVVRVLSQPFSFVLGLGLVGIVVGRERRSLHDVLAGSVVVYDWGERPAEMPAPLTRWLARHGAS